MKKKNLRSPKATLPPVRAWITDAVFPTYLPGRPDPNPMFLEKRVYQGSSGRVYPLPFTDRIAEKPTNRTWKAVWIENEFIRAMVLPELGGRVHVLQDKTNGYDLIYNQPVIKPALVGLAGPWISGGIEFNWPQHHRPETFLPVSFEIEEHADGSRTVWCSDHDPMSRMKGMHGVCLHPGKAYLELKVRTYNRTPFVQTFLWWANAATRVHEAYQSFFPPDVYYVADHAKRAMSHYPRCREFYYGVNYGERGRLGVPDEERPTQFVPPHCLPSGAAFPPGCEVPVYAPDDLSFYANIPTPCSYMCMGSQEDFFGGYDYFARAGIVHYANHHIAPGKKQWTWGNHDFGYSWDRNLTEPDASGKFAPYIELMAGVFTDNQPDFSFLHPGETKTWSQYWYPIQKTGPVQKANLDAAVTLSLATAGGIPRARLGIAVTANQPRAVITLTAKGRPIGTFCRDLSPSRPLLESIKIPRQLRRTEILLRVEDQNGRELIRYQPALPPKGKVPPPATEPTSPARIRSNDELFLTGLHLEQYRHATRCPTVYWREALRRDPLDARCNNALGLWHLRRGEFTQAEKHFRRAIQRLTRRNPNPYDAEPFYNLGLCLTYLQRPTEAYAALYKATWDEAWGGPGYHALAELDCREDRWTQALEHLDRSLRLRVDNTRARNLKVLVLRKMGRHPEAGTLLKENLMLDPLDWWARHLDDEPLRCDLQVQLDLAHDLARSGFLQEALALLRQARAIRRDLPDQSWGASPLVHYTIGWLHEKTGNLRAASSSYRKAAGEPPDYCFPSRLEEIAILQAAIDVNPRDARAYYYLGNLLYDRRRHKEAIHTWEQSVRLAPKFPTAWRNLGIGYFNIVRSPGRARVAYERAFRADPASARLLFERDQLWKRLRTRPESRLRELRRFPDLVRQRDDLSLELCALCNQTGDHAAALRVLESRVFQPWEGGEGGPLGQYVRSRLMLGRLALAAGHPAEARDHFAAALQPPMNLGEAKHLLANQNAIHYWLGLALEALGRQAEARDNWLKAANFKGDFQDMRVRTFSEMTLYSALSLRKLGRKRRARKLLLGLLIYAEKLRDTPAEIDYFATSLPTMLLFEDDLQFRQETTSIFLQAQAHLGLGTRGKAGELFARVRQCDPNHAGATELADAADLLNPGFKRDSATGVAGKKRLTSKPQAADTATGGAGI